MEDVCFSTETRHRFLRPACIAQRWTFNFCLPYLISPHLEQNTWLWREVGLRQDIHQSIRQKCFGRVGSACAPISSRRIHTVSPPGRNHLLNTEVLQHNSSLLPVDHHLLPRFWILTHRIKGGGAFDRRDPTDSAVYLKSDQSANKKKWKSWPQAARKEKKSTWAQPRHSLHHFPSFCFSFNNSVEVFNLWQVVLVYVGLSCFFVPTCNSNLTCQME